jgi:hypothetical protein
MRGCGGMSFAHCQAENPWGRDALYLLTTYPRRPRRPQPEPACNHKLIGGLRCLCPQPYPAATTGGAGGGRHGPLAVNAVNASYHLVPTAHANVLLNHTYKDGDLTARRSINKAELHGVTRFSICIPPTCQSFILVGHHLFSCQGNQFQQKQSTRLVSGSQLLRFCARLYSSRGTCSRVTALSQGPTCLAEVSAMKSRVNYRDVYHTVSVE